MQTQDKEIAIINSKKNNLSERLADYQAEKSTINDNINELTKGLSNNVIEYIDKETGQKITTTSSATRKEFTRQLNDAKERRDKISDEIVRLSEEIGEYDTEMLGIEMDPETSGEIGILKSIAKLTGRGSEVIINWFIWAIMLVFDPLAISLVIGANIIFKDQGKLREREELVESADEKIAELKRKEGEFNVIQKDFDDRLNKVEEKERELEEKRNKMNSIINEKESDIKRREREIEDKLIDLNDSRVKTEEEIKAEKSKINDLQYELTEQRAKLAEEKETFKRENGDIITAKKQIDKDKEEILNREKEMEDKYEEYKTLKGRIDDWRKLHWKIRRNTPPPN